MPGIALISASIESAQTLSGRQSQLTQLHGVGAEYCVSSCDLGVFMQEAAEAVPSGDIDVGVDRIG